MLAVLGALCLVAVAVLVRSAIVGGSDGGDGGSGDGPPVVACTPELAAVCDALADDGRITPASSSLDLDEAAVPPAEIDAWITWDPAPAIANIDAEQANQPEPWSDPVALGGGVLGVLGTEAAIEAACDGQVSWTCLGDAGIEGTTAIGVGEPTTAEGLVRLAPLAQATADDPFDGFSTDPNLDAIIAGPPNGQDTAETMATWQVTRPGQADLVVGPLALLEAEASTAGGEARRLVATLALNDQPVAVVATWRSDAGDALAELCEGDGIDEGSATATALVAAGVPELCPGPAGLADDQLAGFLYQVRERVS